MAQAFGAKNGFTGKKVDTSDMGAKIQLRRWLLKRMGIEEAYVLDTCAGLGKVWEEMQKHVTVRQWTRCDIKPRRAGVLKLDATEAIERMPIGTFNVIDIDPYGEPWEPYLALLPRIAKPVAVFLTNCQLSMGNISITASEAIGIPRSWYADLPCAQELHVIANEIILSNTLKHAKVLHAAKVEKPGGMSVSYYGLGLGPITKV